MAYFEFPHTREYEGDLGFIIKKIIELSENYEQFFRYNTIHFADPIEWSITSQYPAFTIVFDTQNASSYISKQPVPAGITLDNSDFWSFVGPLIVDGYARTQIERVMRFVTGLYEPGFLTLARQYKSCRPGKTNSRSGSSTFYICSSNFLSSSSHFSRLPSS